MFGIKRSNTSEVYQWSANELKLQTDFCCRAVELLVAHRQNGQQNLLILKVSIYEQGLRVNVKLTKYEFLKSTDQLVEFMN